MLILKRRDAETIKVGSDVTVKPGPHLMKWRRALVTL